jgi:hypothetical protein
MSTAFQALLKWIHRVPALRSGPNRYGSTDPDCGTGGLPVYCAADRGFVRTNRIRALELRLAGVEAALLRLTRQPPVAVPAVESPVMEAPVLKAAQCCSWPSGLVIRLVNNEPASTPNYISSFSLAVDGPITVTEREGVHSKCARWLLGQLSSLVTASPRPPL